MRSPFRVLSWRHVATMPPIVVSGSIGFGPPGPQASPREPFPGRSARSAAERRADTHQRFDRAFADVLDRGQTKTNAFGRLHGKPELALVEVWRQDWNAAFAAFTQIKRQLVGVLRLDGQKRRCEMPRIIGF